MDFAGAVAAHEGDRLAGGDGEVDVGEGVDVAAVDIEGRDRRDRRRFGGR